ncbi:MAG: urea transporter [candidate division WOR-3 bacterium]
MKNCLTIILSSILDSYSVIFFIDNKKSTHSTLLGLIILLASFTNPVVGLSGLWGVLISLAFAWLVRLTDFVRTTSYYSFNSLLVSLGVGYFLGRSFDNYLILLGIIFLLAIFVTILSVSLENFLRNYLALPVLSLPFVLILLLTLAIYNNRINPIWAFKTFVLGGEFLPTWLNLYLKSLGSIIFSPNLVAGALVFLVILIYSRIMGLLSLVGFFVGCGVIRALGVFDPDALMLLGFNTILTAIAIGGVFFVPDITSVLLAVIASGVGVILGLGFQNLLAPWQLPVVAIPFNLVVLVILYGFKHRLSNLRPYLVPFYMGSPEENLEYYNIRIVRFPGQSYYQFYLPFNGEWIVSQGNKDQITHRYDWQYAWDFEVADEEGRRFIRNGQELEDYYAYDKPVLAPADGVVVKIVDWILDNPIGVVNTKENWGNFIVLEHQGRVYSLLAHLKYNSIKVREGEYVKAGQVLASCGNSGRSLIPHLHFHIQANPEVGSRTIRADIVNYLQRTLNQPGLVWIKIGCPQKNDVVSNFPAEAHIQELLNFRLGNQLKYKVVTNHKIFYEAWEVKLDFWGNLYLEANNRARAYFSVNHGIFYLLKFEGRPNSALYALALALPSFGYVRHKSYTFTDQPPIISSLPLGIRILHDALSFLTRPLRFSARYQVSPVSDETIKISGDIGLYFMKFKLKNYQSDVEFDQTYGIRKITVRFDTQNVFTAERIS